MGSSLVAFDTDHIKRYVFATNKLKEIRGASSLLDYLNRDIMTGLAGKHHAELVYANGGSGLFRVPTEDPHTFIEEVQQAYHDRTGGGVSVTATYLPLPENIKDNDNLTNPLELLHWQLQEEKEHPRAFLALPSHPFMRLCDACGAEYADARAVRTESTQDSDDDDESDPGEEGERYCESCLCKRERNDEVRKFIKYFVRDKDVRRANSRFNDYLWKNVISGLAEMEYVIPPKTRRPRDFNVFSNFKGAKNYLALIYADGNNMGNAIKDYNILNERKMFAETIDKTIYTSVCTAIAQHLKIEDHLKPQEQRMDDLDHPVFPFDILLLGGDDICMVVPASVALDVALTIAETFRNETLKARDDDKLKQAHTLSVGVVLAPVKYPFGLLREMAETTLKFAKRAGADARSYAKKTGKKVDDTRINFMVVTGGSSSDFKSVYNDVYRKLDDDDKLEFQATQRPYAPDDLRRLLDAIRDKDGANLGRTKLHQVREAVLKMNLTTSVSDGLAVLRNWRQKQRDYIVRNVYEFAGRYKMPVSNPDDPVKGFPRITFPWFAYGKKMYKDTEYEIYRTSLLDFVELYDFVSREGGVNDPE